MRYTFHAVYFKGSDGWIVAYIEELNGAIVQGRTMEETERNLRDAATLVLYQQREQNRKCARGMERINRREITVEPQFGRIQHVARKRVKPRRAKR